MERLKVGDIVEVKTWDELAKEFGIDFTGAITHEFGFVKSMKKFCGKKLRIEKIDIDTFYLEDGEGWCFAIDMFKR